VDGKITEQITIFRNNMDMEEKLNRFHFFCGTTRNTLGKKVCKEMLLKLYKVMVIPSLLCGCKTWTLSVEQVRTEAAEM